MFNLSENTVITGFSGKRGALAQIVNDKNLHRDLRFDRFSSRVRRGTFSALINGTWKTVRFDVLDGWAKTVEVL